MDGLIVQLAMLDGETGKSTEALNCFSSEVVQNSLLTIEYGECAFRVSRTGDQRHRMAELDPGIQYFPQRGEVSARGLSQSGSGRHRKYLPGKPLGQSCFGFHPELWA